LLPDPERPGMGGKCMDGTQAGWYYGAPPNGESDLLVIYLKGGGGCGSIASCENWGWGKGKGTSGWRNGEIDPDVDDPLETTKPAQGKLSIDENTNPHFFNAHHVFVEYCTGDGHAGRIGNPDPVLHRAGEKDLYMDGHLNFKRILEELGKEDGISQVKRVLLYGSSAGGLGVYVNCDYLWREMKKRGVSVKCAPESGLYMQGYWQGGDEELDPLRAPQLYPLWKANVTTVEELPEICNTWADRGVQVPETCGGSRWQKKYLPPQCVKEHPDSPDVCLSAGTIYRHMKAPLYVNQDEFDTSPLGQVGLGKCRERRTESGTDYVRRFGAAVRETLKFHKHGDGVYLTSCLQHGGHTANVDGGSVSYEQSLGDWFHERGQPEDHRLMDACTEEGSGLPCNAACLGLDDDCCTSAFITECVDSFESVDKCVTCAQRTKGKLLREGCEEGNFQSMCEDAVVEA